MSTISKDSLIKEAQEKAEFEAAKRSTDEYKTESLVHEAQEIIEDIFYSFTWMQIENGIVKSTGPLESWHHRHMNEIESDWKLLNISRDYLQNTAERYLDRPWMQSKNIDWLILNTLTYAEYQATLDFIRSKLMPFNQYIAKKTDSSKGVLVSNIWVTLVFILKWFAWLSIFRASFLIFPYGPFAWCGLTAWWIWRKVSAKKKIAEVLISMFSTYSAFSTISQSWAIVWDELNKSRDKGAVWDGVVYRLVEERKQQFSYRGKST